MDDPFETRLVCEALIEQNPGLDRVQAAALTMEGLVRVNGYPVRHPRQRVHRTDQVTIDGASASGTRPSLLPPVVRSDCHA